MDSGQIQIVMNIFFIVAPTFLMGIFIGTVIARHRPVEHVGSFIVNHTDPTKDLCTLHLDVDLDVIEASKYITFKVVVIDDAEDNKK